MCCESGAWIVYRESGAKKRVFCGENLPVCGERAVDMGFFSNMYTKEGPGVRKDQPPKKGIPRFFEILMRDYGHLLKVNFLFLLCCLPMVTVVLFGLLFWVYLIIPGLGRRDTYLFNMLPYLVTIAVLIFVSLRNKKENQPPASLGLAYFREER